MFKIFHIAQSEQDSKKTFNELSNITFEKITNGRQGAVLVAPTHDGLIPIVRTTTKYEDPPQLFLEQHLELIKQIGVGSWNNALIEIYSDTYRSMGYHSDQALDLAPDSQIAIYSHYDDGQANRILRIKDKVTGETQDILLEHQSVVMFSTETNRKYLHKIILDKPGGNRWLGMTLRVSKTHLAGLHLASDEEKKEFYKLRGQENKLTNFVWPEISYTLSPSDLMEKTLLRMNPP